MSIVTETLKKRITEYEQKLTDPEISEWTKEKYTRSLDRDKRTLTILENSDLTAHWSSIRNEDNHESYKSS